MSTIDSGVPQEQEDTKGSIRVLWVSTLAFTLMFAVWLMFGVLGVAIKQELGLSDTQLAWIAAVAILNGSMWRLPAGMIADRIGGRKVFAVLLLASAVFSLAVAYAHSYVQLLILAFFVGIAGNSFTAGISWNSAWSTPQRQGLALGIFGAGNLGASVTKFIGPAIITATVGQTYFGGLVSGGWRLVPVIYTGLLILMAMLVWFGTPAQDRAPGQGRTLKERLKPLKHLQVWRFSLYYVAVFGAYVALSAWLPNYYVSHFTDSAGQPVSLQTAALITASFIFPASLLRPVGGWLSDRFGARLSMRLTFSTMLVTAILLSLPRTVLPLLSNLMFFAVIVFIHGCAMGIGKAAVYKHIPTYYPADVGAVGGLVGMLGGLGGFVLPPLFAAFTPDSYPGGTFLVMAVLIGICALWMELAIRGLKKGRV
ncbi:MAG: MFS transporter [Actinomycetaceae bacterium]|nr:MFS transporter [Actinomycetaceae bacterium]